METFRNVAFPKAGKKLYVLGRNRHTEICGLEIFNSLATGEVVLTPVNANGSTSKGCHISLPQDKRTLENIAAALLAAASGLPE